MSRRNFNWTRSVKSGNVNEHCLFNESITLKRVLHIRYFLLHNSFTSPKKFIYLEIILLIKNAAHGYCATNQSRACVLWYSLLSTSSSSNTWTTYCLSPNFPVRSTLMKPVPFVPPLFPSEPTMTAIPTNVWMICFQACFSQQTRRYSKMVTVSFSLYVLESNIATSARKTDKDCV